MADMSGTQPNPSNSDPFKFLMEFDTMREGILLETSGHYQIAKPNEHGVMEIEYIRDAKNYPHPLCNLEGGKYIVHKLGLFWNSHVAMGNIKKGRAAHLAGDIIRQTFGNMLTSDDQYGITDVNAFSDEALTMQDALETFLTSIENSGIRDWSSTILAIRIGHNISSDTNGPTIGKKPGLLDRIRGSRDV